MTNNPSQKRSIITVIALAALGFGLFIAGGQMLLHEQPHQDQLVIAPLASTPPIAPIAAKPKSSDKSKTASHHKSTHDKHTDPTLALADVPSLDNLTVPTNAPADLSNATPPPQRVVSTQLPQSAQDAGSLPTKKQTIAQSKMPPLELQRQRDEGGASAQAAFAVPVATVPDDQDSNSSASKNIPVNDGIHIESDFEGAQPIDVKQISPTHFQLSLKSAFKDWFIFRVVGAAGKIVRFDFSLADENVDRWQSLNPVYSYAKDLDDPQNYLIDASTPIDKPITAWNGSLLPSTKGQKWHFVTDTWSENSRTFSFVQQFDQANAFVAMRVPYPTGYNETYISRLRSNPLVKVVEVGQSLRQRPLLLVTIGDGDDQAQQHKPCILVYAGEHSDEQDSMWAAHGVIEYLLAASDKAKQLRHEFTFLIIPMLDPDMAATGRHSGMICTFMTDTKTPESIAYANWFQDWVNKGNRLDVIFDLHNVQSGERSQVSCALLEGVGTRGAVSKSLNSLLVNNFRQAGFAPTAKPWMYGWSPDRLGGWLSRRYGPLCFAYELNGQASDRHLSISQIQNLGATFAEGTAQFLRTAKGTTFLQSVDARRDERLSRWAKHEAIPTTEDAIDAEADVSKGVGILASKSDNLLVETWVP